MAKDKEVSNATAPTPGVGKPLKKEVGTNALRLPFPSDPQGATSKLKAGGITAARRVGGDRAKLDRMLEVLDVLKAHAIEVFKADVNKRKIARDNAVNARARVAEKNVRQVEAKAADLEKIAAKLRADAGIEVKAEKVADKKEA